MYVCHAHTNTHTYTYTYRVASISIYGYKKRPMYVCVHVRVHPSVCLPISLCACYQLSEDVRYVFIFVAYFNSSLNPILYAVLNERFRQAIKELWHACCRRCRQRNKIYPGRLTYSPDTKIH